LKGHETGIELAHWLREQRIPFIFLSANLTDNVLADAKVTQPFGFLNKPFREKDVLTTLEIARYRHAHSEEAILRQQRDVQIAVNNAIVTVHDRDQLCLAIAAQIDKLVPFALLNLRIGLPEEQSFYWVLLRKTALGTFERVQLRELVILKRNGRRTPFERDKLERSLGVALRKRPVQADQVEQMVNRIVRQLESLGETEIQSSTVGDFIMKALKGVDEVAYVRYASVYKDFRHTGDFAKFLGDEGLDEPSGKA
jgi:transcriptional repressor NrdR